MQKTPHVAWVTAPADDTPRRVELNARDIPDCIRRVLATMPRGSRVTCRSQVRGCDVERRAS